MTTPLLRSLLATALLGSASLPAAEPHDVVIYGGTAAAVTAAVQAKKMGKSVIIVSPDKHLGGLTSGGLGWTDSGNKTVIGGLAREFYHRLWQHYQKPESWPHQNKAAYGNKGQGTHALDDDQQCAWVFEPSVAERHLDAWIAELEIPVVREARLDRAHGVEKDAARITAITTLDGTRYPGRIFLDATYEGDLMAAAGIDYHVGRESIATYGEEWNGVQTGVLHHKHHFETDISPYIVPGDPSSGVLPRISTEAPGEYGSSDDRVQAYCFRMCLTNVPENRVAIEKPEGYDPKQYELLVRVFDSGWRAFFHKFDLIPNGKTDTNNHGPFSFDNIGFNYDYPDASYERRAEIIREHETYQKGLLYFVATDPRIPAEIQAEMKTWGLPKDEFTDNGHWSHQLYIREARRMVGHFIMTENELRKKKPTPDSVGMGSYAIDSHNTERYIKPDGFVQNEGDIGVSTRGPYPIAYGALVPRAEQCTNLLVPVACSASHIAYGSIRMEPVFMILGQSAATAASLALDAEIAVQDVPYDALKKRLLEDGQVLTFQDPDSAQLEGIVVDDIAASFTGDWPESRSTRPFYGVGYAHDNKDRSTEKTATFTTDLPADGRYEVRLAYSAAGSRASNVTVRVEHAQGTETVTVDQRKPGSHDGIACDLGTFDFKKDQPARVTLTNEGANGYVTADAVQWIPVK
ncbi:MAG: FAD-dependent oxidoreductase [Verrucomicrobiales bacterium]|nr:FAD-dependent oxidoreductase [Verrucomicrobiales bacterium]